MLPRETPQICGGLRRQPISTPSPVSTCSSADGGDLRASLWHPYRVALAPPSGDVEVRPSRLDTKINRSRRADALDSGPSRLPPPRCWRWPLRRFWARAETQGQRVRNPPPLASAAPVTPNAPPPLRQRRPSRHPQRETTGLVQVHAALVDAPSTRHESGRGRSATGRCRVGFRAAPALRATCPRRNQRIVKCPKHPRRARPLLPSFLPRRQGPGRSWLPAWTTVLRASPRGFRCQRR